MQLLFDGIWKHSGLEKILFHLFYLFRVRNQPDIMFLLTGREWFFGGCAFSYKKSSVVCLQGVLTVDLNLLITLTPLIS